MRFAFALATISSALTLFAPMTSWAQNAPPGAPAAYDHSTAPVARASRVNPGAVTIDGRLDEAAWASAEPVTQFTQFDPKEGEPATQRTEVRILIDGNAIYFGARMFESDPAKVRPRLARRDEPVDGDVLAITLDSRHDHVSGYFFRITAGGAVRDAVATQGGDDVNLDLTWDAVWEAKTSIDAQGWIAEIRIPLSQIPYNRVRDPVWGIQIERFRWNEFEQDFFAFTGRREVRGLQRYGHLLGLGDLPAPSRIELLPYLTTRGEYRIVDANNPFRSGDDYFVDAGLDLKYRLTSNVTVNATFNPDFGQVEVDPAVVNLTQFETFFPERRPFFIEGRELFRFGQIRTYNSFGFPTVFFSRRIGRTPQGGIGGDTIAHVDAPDQSTILGAAKITGKTAQGWSLGILEAVTGKEDAEFLTTTNGRGKVIVEPLTNYFIGRVGREMRRGNTLAGAYVSAVNRRLEDDVLASFLRREAYAGGVDLQQTWSNRTWALDASVLASHVSGTREAILATQTAPARYYQRPDAESFRVDSGRTSLAGVAGQVALTKLAGTHWLGNVAWQQSSPGFEVNDIGFQTNVDRRAFSTDFFYRETKAGKRFRNYVGGVFTNQAWNSDGDIVFNNYAAFLELNFLNFSGLNLRYDLSADSYDDRLTRGGPVVRSLHGWSGQVNWYSDQRKRAFGNINVYHDSYASGATSTSVSTNVNWSPSPTVSLVAGPQWFRGYNPAQFRRIEAGGPAATYGRRYIFAELEQRELSMTARVNWTFSPVLSLQTFVQPLVSAGDFGQQKQLRAARTFDFDPVVGSADASDFNFRSPRGNAVLRWEYRPGSTLYLVWQQFRSGEERFGEFRFGRDVRGVFESRPENVVAVKATYWLPL